MKSLLRMFLSALCLVLIGSTSAWASTPTWLGLDDSSVTAGQLSAAKAASISQTLKANSARISLNWAWVQPTSSAPNFSTFDSIYQADIADGIHPLITLVGSPSWTWTPGTTCPNGGCVYPPGTKHDADWQSFVSAVAKRYPQAAGIEIWNEPNMSWEWNSGVDPVRYTALLKLAYAAIKKVNPSMPVIAGALAVDLESTASASAEPLPQFLQAMYQNGATGYMNGISIHPYPGAMDMFYALKGISDTEEIRDSNHDTVPVWVTETGLSTQQFTQGQQAEMDAELVTALRGERGLGGVYLSTLVEPATGGAGLGLLSSALGTNPAFCSVAAALGSSYVCPPTVVVPHPGATQTGRWQAQALLQYAADAAIAYHAAHGTYTGMTSTSLNAIDSRISAVAADGTPAGPTADPSKVGVYPMSGGTGILLCNASVADLSYCTGGSYLAGWKWWQSTGSAYNAASVAMHS